MKKKQYIQPLIKNRNLTMERHLLQQGSEQTSNPWDWNSKQGTFDEEDSQSSNVWGSVDW